MRVLTLFVATLAFAQYDADTLRGRPPCTATRTTRCIPNADASGNVAIGTTVLKPGSVLASPFVPTAPTVTATYPATNALSSSTDITQAPWGVDGVATGRTHNATTAPDGTATADLLTEGTANTYQDLYQVLGAAQTGQTTISVWAKAHGRTWFAVKVNDGGNIWAHFDLSTGAAGTNNIGTGSITGAGSGWWHITVTRNATSISDIAFSPAPANGTVSYQGDGASGVYLWRPRVSSGATATWAYCTAAFASDGAVSGCYPSTYVANAGTLDSNNTNAVTPACVSGASYYQIWRMKNGTVQGAVTVGASKRVTCGSPITDNGLTADGSGLPIADVATVFGAGPMASVVAYGATGDGATDDTAALQKALNDGRGTVFVPPGNYLFSALAVPNGVTLVCADPVQTTLTYTGSGIAIQRADLPSVPSTWTAPQWYTSAFSRFAVRGCHILKQGAVAGTGVDLAATSHSVVEDNVVEGFATGIDFHGENYGSFWNTVRNNFLYKTSTGVKLGSSGGTSANHNTVQENRCFECNVGYAILGGVGNLILRNNAEYFAGANPIGIRVSSNGTVVQANWLESSSAGFTGVGTGIKVEYDGNTIRDNYGPIADSASWTNYDPTTTTANTLSGNTFAGQTTKGTPTTAADACPKNEIWADAGYVYVCTATGVIKRSAIAGW